MNIKITITILLLFVFSIVILSVTLQDTERIEIQNVSFELPNSYKIYNNNSDHEVEIINDTNKLVIVQMINKSDLNKTINDYINNFNNSISIETFMTTEDVEITKTSTTLNQKEYVRYYFYKSDNIFHIDTQNEVDGTDKIAMQIANSIK